MNNELYTSEPIYCTMIKNLNESRDKLSVRLEIKSWRQQPLIKKQKYSDLNSKFEFHLAQTILS